ncbi:MAG TPA: tripartite tricarboxylate transporter substrate-binding protein [Beijerinckiaceae bacterium]|nr:tripartite tricarboxylate transporter substrate-binding protein [Beijerinckiaceae bacterium]
MLRTAIVAVCLAWIGGAAPTADAQGNTAKGLDIYVGSSPGAGYDLYARLLSRYMDKYLPGKPTIRVINMDGAGGLTLANWLYSVAPHDGQILGTFGRGVAFENLLEPQHATFDGRKFGWVGSMNDEVSVCVAWNTSGITKFEDLQTKELTVGATGAGGDTYVLANLLNSVLGTKLKIVNGYPGGNEISLALERGEVQGRCGWSWSSLKATHMDWIKSGKMRVIVQLGLNKHPDLPDVPSALDFVKTPEQRDILKLVFARETMAWPFATPPGVPPARLAEFRKAFVAATKDPDLLSEAEKSQFEIRPVTGEQIDKILADAYNIPAATISRTAELLK